MIVGVGIDIIEINRIGKAASKAAFLQRVFTEREIQLYRGRGGNAAVLAGCFAGKEAVSKALGSGFRGFWPADVEILREESGKPFVVLYGGALALSASLEISRWHISLSNTAEYAAAYAVAEAVR